MRVRRSIAVGAAATALVFGGAACSDDGGSESSDTTDESTDDAGGESADAWVADVCTALDDWITQLEAATEDVQDVLSLSGEVGGSTGTDTGTDTGNTGSDDADLEEQKELLGDFLDTAVDLTDTLIDDIEDAGTPDVEDGEEIQEVFLSAFDDARDTFAEARDKVEELPTDDAEEFADEVLDIGDDIDVAAIEIQTAFNEAGDEFDTSELDDAFEDEEACEAIQ